MVIIRDEQIFEEIYGLPQDFRHKNGEMKQVPYRGTTDISRDCQKFSRLGDLVFGICAPLMVTMIT